MIILKRIEDVKEKVILFRPVYTDQGNITELFFLEDNQLRKACDRRHIIRVRQAFARCFALDLSAQAKDLQQKFNRKFPLPFYFPDGRLFVPLKMRKPKIVGDSTYGYVDITYIKSIRKIDNDVELTLATDDKIPLCSSAVSAYNIINLGKEIANQLKQKQENEQDKILNALGILIAKLYRIEKILSQV